MQQSHPIICHYIFLQVFQGNLLTSELINKQKAKDFDLYFFIYIFKQKLIS